jgi:ABC-2 type transport system ATP-binding protein
MTETENAIEATGVTKTFDGDTVLDGIDLAIQTDETTLLMGPNGSGKTILLSCLAGGLHPSTGKITVFGESPSAARAEMNFMLQGGLALPELSGRENIDFYAGLHPAATDRWREIIDRLDLAGELEKRVRDYSGGMVRKLELAIAMSVDVPLYLFDEPAAELDLTTIDRFHALISRERERDKTIVISSHTPADVEIADRIVFIREGRVVADGEPDSLFDALPPVVRTTGVSANSERLREHVRDGRLFEGDSVRRGFLTEETTPEQTETMGDGVQIDEPTWTDLFNYYVYTV